MKIKKQFQKLLPGLILYSLVFVRYLYYGTQYFHQLDDYIQYHNYTFFTEDLWQLVLDLGMLASRPAAGPADLFVWSNFFGVMLLAVAILSALYTATGLLLRDIFRKYFKISWLFAVIFALLPLGFEGTYWVSASSRVVCGLFFTVLGAWFLQRYWDGGHWWLLFPAMLLQLFGSCFYEQALVFSVTLFVLMGLLNWMCLRLKALWGGFPILNALLYFILTSFAPTGAYSARMELVLPKSAYYFDTFLPDILGQLKAVFWDGGWLTTLKGFWRGLCIMAEDGAILFALLLLVLCGLFGFAISRQGEAPQKGRLPTAVLVGFLLALAPVTPFLVIANPWFSVRGAVASFAGIALVADAVLTALWSKCRKEQVFSSIIAAATALVFCVGGVAELHDYKQTHEDDHKVADAILEQIDLSDPAMRIGLLGVEKSFLEEQTFTHNEHIHGVTESNWALTGLLQYRTKNESLPTVVPLQTQNIYRAWNYESNRIDGFDRLYYYDHASGQFTPLRYEQTAERAFDLFLEDGTLFGRVEEQDGQARLIK